MKSHEAYVGAQAKVDDIEDRLWTAQEALAELDQRQDSIVQAIVGALIVDGHSYKNPLGAFTKLSPGKLMRLAHANKAEEIRRLVAAIRREGYASKATLLIPKTSVGVLGDWPSASRRR